MVRFGVRLRLRVRVRPFSRSREVRFWTRPGPGRFLGHTLNKYRCSRVGRLLVRPSVLS